ncbi:hemolysin family protein [Cohnella pontilimi]|nr:hemolysin family protein [Cohnella pontilimi]
MGNLLLVLFFVLCTAFFVAAEYSVIRSRMSRIEQLAAEGSKKALRVKQIISRLDEYLSACQLGNTLTNLAIGWLGESAVERLLHPLFVLLRIPASLTGMLSFLIAFLLLTFVEVVIGELVPKTLAIRLAEPLAMFLARPLMLFFKITYPFSWFMTRSARLVTGLFGVKAITGEETTHTEAELRLILSEGYKSGIINPSEFRYVTNIFELDDRVAKESMVPRTDIDFAHLEDTVLQFVERTAVSPHSQYPVIEGADKDRVVGMVEMKEVLSDYIRGVRDPNGTLQLYLKPVIQVIETISVQDLLLKMQKDRITMAVLIDEFGGTSGLITVKDIIRKIVEDQKEARDDLGQPLIEKLQDGRYIVSAKLPIADVNRLLGTKLDEEGVYTLAGWMMSRKYELHENDKIGEDKCDFIVRDMEERQIRRVEIVRHNGGAPQGDKPAARA